MLPVAVLLGTLVMLLVMTWAATAGPVRLFSGFGTASEPARPTAIQPSPPASSLPTYRQITRNVHPTVDLSWLGELIGYAVLLGVGIGCLLLVRGVWRTARQDRWLRVILRLRRRRPSAVPFDVLPDRQTARDTLEADAESALDAVETGGPRDGIVACWLSLEDTVAASGVPPRPSETSTELVTRVLHALDVDPRPVAVLAELYREARFSEHVMGEESRERARSALRSLREDAARLKAPT